jgi:hypothetical protein
LHKKETGLMPSHTADGQNIKNDKKSKNVHVYLYEVIEFSSKKSVTQSDSHIYMTTANVNMNM